MERRSVAPRSGWQQAVEAQGLIWHTDEGTPYWDESGCYVFRLAEIEMLEEASEAVHQLYMEAGDRVVRKPDLLRSLGIPDYCHDAIRAEWKQDRPALDYGRFDFGYDGTDDPKLFEFNCDTPTAMLEAGVVQWDWKEQVFPHNDQYTSLHEKLIDRWRFMARDLPSGRVWFTHLADMSHEDTVTTTYMRDLAAQAGLETHQVLVDHIGLDAQGRIVDGEDNLITAIFKLYPWEWIVSEGYGPAIVRNLQSTLWLEPIWKMIWSNKAILALLWDMFPNHKNLLPASLDAVKAGPSYVSKPIHAREGANIELVEDGQVVERSGGGYDGPRLYQQSYPLKNFGHGYPVLGCWVVGGEAAGMGIREDGRITGNRARFIPHIIEGSHK